MSEMVRSVRAYRPGSMRTDPQETESGERVQKEINIRTYRQRAARKLPLFLMDTVGDE